MEEGRRGSTASLSCEAGTWERHPDQWRWVLWIFEQVARGKGGKIVAKMLNERGVPPPRGGAWSAETVRRIVHSPAYTGRLVRRMNDSEFTFEVPVIVPPDLWRIANEAIEGNRRTSPRNRKHEYLLSSTRDAPLLCCRVCHETMGKDYLMGGRSNGTKTKPDWLFYQCNGRHGRDAAHTVSAQRIEAAVWDALVALLTGPRVALEHIAKLSDTASKQYHEHEQALAGLHERAAEVRAARVRLAEAAAWGKLPAEILEAQATALEEQAQEIAGQISLAHVQLEQARAEVVPIRDIEDAARSWLPARRPPPLSSGAGSCTRSCSASTPIGRTGCWRAGYPASAPWARFSHSSVLSRETIVRGRRQLTSQRLERALPQPMAAQPGDHQRDPATLVGRPRRRHVVWSIC